MRPRSLIFGRQPLEPLRDVVQFTFAHIQGGYVEKVKFHMGHIKFLLALKSEAAEKRPPGQPSKWVGVQPIPCKANL